MVELKDYFEGLKESKEKVLLWVNGDDDTPVAMRTYIREVFQYEGRLAGLGCSPDLSVEYMEYIPMDEIIKFSIMTDGLIEKMLEAVGQQSEVMTDIKS